ncbi:MAG: hypothetical protein IJG33_03810 [Selenomonadaceae bacterium]|nr:hypothetical protein [Selenomonadaceae bacterium]
MSELERDTERRITTLESNVNNLVAELRDFKAEMRQQNQMRAEEARELRQKHDEDMRAVNARIDTKFDALTNQIHTLTIAAVVGFGALALAVGGLIVSLMR